MPALVRPSRVQDSILHPVCIDYVPWPRLRDYLCLNQNRDTRHSVDLYMRSIRLRWPREQRLLGLAPGGHEVQLSDEFEAVVGDVRHWHLGPPWADVFPQLRELLGMDE